ncbi:MAG: hypothetical protein AB9903_21340 [Vulcanimicrobiota bacterium]
MTLQSLSTVNPQLPMAAQQIKKTEPEQQNTAANTTDNVTINQDAHDKHDITIAQAFKGLTGAAIGATIETVGNTASSLVNLPKATFHAAKTIWKTDVIGPVLKTSLTALLPVAVAATPALVALGSLGFGIFRGFSEGMEHGLGEAVKASAKDVKTFHKDLASKAVNELQNLETPHLEPGEKPYDIKIIEAGKGIVGAAAGAVIDGAGVGGLTLAKLPKGSYKVYEGIFKSDIGPVAKTTASILAPVVIALATPLATVGGAVYGVYKGFADAYKEGLVDSVKNRLHDVKQYHEATAKLLDHSWDK